MKHLNDILSEGILDTDLDRRVENDINQMAVAWVLEHISEHAVAKADLVKKHLTVNKDHTLSIDMVVDLSIEESMPDYVQFDDVYNIEYRIFNKKDSEITINIPNTTGALKVVTYKDRGKSLTLNMKSNKGTKVDDIVEARGDINNIIFPKKFSCNELDLQHLDNLNLGSTKYPNCKTLRLPQESVKTFIRNLWKIDAERIIY